MFEQWVSRTGLNFSLRLFHWYSTKASAVLHKENSRCLFFEWCFAVTLYRYHFFYSCMTLLLELINTVCLIQCFFYPMLTRFADTHDPVSIAKNIVLNCLSSLLGWPFSSASWYAKRVRQVSRYFSVFSRIRALICRMIWRRRSGLCWRKRRILPPQSPAGLYHPSL